MTWPSGAVYEKDPLTTKASFSVPAFFRLASSVRLLPLLVSNLEGERKKARKMS
jgi:hypothetical protein